MIYDEKALINKFYSKINYPNFYLVLMKILNLSYLYLKFQKIHLSISKKVLFYHCFKHCASISYNQI